MKTDFVALCASQKAEKRALVRIGGGAKSWGWPIVSCEGAIDDCLIKILAFPVDSTQRIHTGGDNIKWTVQEFKVQDG